MNKARRTAIADLIRQLDDIPDLNELATAARELASEEQDYFDNMPESLQGGEKGQAAEQAASALEELADALEQAASALEDANAAASTASEA